jgi:hypothetical protein
VLPHISRCFLPGNAMQTGTGMNAACFYLSPMMQEIDERFTLPVQKKKYSWYKTS